MLAALVACLVWMSASSPLAVTSAASSQATAAGNRTAILGLLGRPDAAEGAYVALLEVLRNEAASAGLELVDAVSSSDLQGLLRLVADARAVHRDAAVFLAGHGMAGGAAALQDAAPAQPGVAGVILLGGFLRRTWRPSVAECKSRWASQPTRSCPEGKGLPFCLGGYLPEGVHACGGPDVPAPVYPLPTLTIGGDLDGVVRVARIAEAWYTQRGSPVHTVALIEGMNHGVLMDLVPEVVAARDLAPEMGARAARSAVSKLVLAFMASPGKFYPEAQDDVFAPFVEMFARQEGSWWWTSNSDENGSSLWASNAQLKMSQPMPDGFNRWQASSEFRMLSDEAEIPPYFRAKHRPTVALAADNTTLVSATVAQLRYIKLSVGDVVAGLNGRAVIREEKAGVLSQPGFVDDGAEPVSALEIGSKLVSRQASYSVVGASAPESLDGGDRCKPINQAAFDAALAAASPRARSRFKEKGRRLFMGPDQQPMPPAGPWWIWKYLVFNDMGDQGVEVRSWYAFYPLSGPAYGAGNHYCKLLSPARALEWIYTDSLRPVLASKFLAV